MKMFNGDGLDWILIGCVSLVLALLYQWINGTTLNATGLGSVIISIGIFRILFFDIPKWQKEKEKEENVR